MPTYERGTDGKTWTVANAADLIDGLRAGLVPIATDAAALMAQWPPRNALPPNTIIRVDSVEHWLEDAIACGVIRVVKPVANPEVKDEWKECRSTIDRFDKILVDLRKTGFGFVTAIVSGATFFFVPDRTKPVLEDARFSVFTIIMVLTLTLYVVDRVHQVWLQEAVDLDAVRTDLLAVVNQAVEPAHASVWIGAAGGP